MASLTHVCMWSDHGWKRITAEQAARLHPGGTVSARSGLFMCELCGQYVTLTDGDIKERKLLFVWIGKRSTKTY